MANHYFQFKQFIIQQEKAALKVSTDSCLFGAWVANEMESGKLKVENALDIGAGSGLLMLMMAQKCNAAIDGIEIDTATFFQAKENMEACVWKSRLQLIHADVKSFRFQKKYNFIISNPPFYEADLKSDSFNRNVAMHDEGLKLIELLHIVNENLDAEGNFAVLLPYHRTDEFISNALSLNLFLNKRLNVRQTINHSYFRSLLLFGRKKTESDLNELSIKNELNQYTTSFENLLKDYYLYL
jgi:tRNA1Val (adenine37-N6)-methyltransferase